MTIFEKIINGSIPSFKVYEDEKFIAILDINPTRTGHTLVIPKKVKENVLQEDSITRSELFELSTRISNNLMDKLNAHGIKWITNVNSVAGQEVFHTHIHLIPYYEVSIEPEANQKILNLIKMV